MFQSRMAVVTKRLFSAVSLLRRVPETFAE
jgi:hypothetical protein